MAGLTPFEIRYINAVRPGDTLPNGQIADENTAIVETLDAVREICEKNPKAGIACAIKNSGLGVGVPDTGKCRITVKNGKSSCYIQRGLHWSGNGHGADTDALRSRGAYSGHGHL